MNKSWKIKDYVNFHFKKTNVEMGKKTHLVQFYVAFIYPFYGTQKFLTIETSCATFDESIWSILRTMSTIL
jgi:hypothetical protein